MAHPETHASDTKPGPWLFALSGCKLSHTYCALAQSLLSSALGPPPAQGTQVIFARHPAALITASETKRIVRQPLGSVEVIAGGSVVPQPCHTTGLFCVGPLPIVK